MTSTPVQTGEVLDERMVSSLRAFGHEPGKLLREMVEDFLTEAPSLMADLERTAADGDMHGTARVAHRMKGLGGHMGAVRLAAIAGEVETLARSGLRDATASATVTARNELALALVAARDLR